MVWKMMGASSFVSCWPWHTTRDKLTVADRVLARPLLEGEHGESHDEADGVALGENLAPGGTSGLLLFLADSGLDFGKLELDILVVDGSLADPGKVLEGLLIAVLGRKPTRRLLEERKKHHHDSDGDELETDRNTPLLGTGVLHERDTVVDPEGNLGRVLDLARADLCSSTHSNTEDDNNLEHASDATTDLLGSNLRRVGGANHGHDSDTEASDETSNVELVETAEACGLNDTANDEDDTSDHESHLTSQAVLHGSTENGTEERTTLENRDNVALERGEVGDRLAIGTQKTELLLERLDSEHTTTKTCVISEEEDAEEANDGQEVLMVLVT